MISLKKYIRFSYFKLPKAIARFWGSLPTRSVVQGSGSYSLKEDVLIRVRLSYFVYALASLVGVVLILLEKHMG